jgi:hypothetical protein
VETKEKRLIKRCLIRSIPRYVGEAVVLFIAWHHSHWSVAVMITTLTANFELQDVINKLVSPLISKDGAND